MSRLVLFVRGPWHGRVEAVYPPHEFVYKVADFHTLEATTYRRRTFIIDGRLTLQLMVADDGGEMTHGQLVEALAKAARLELQRIPR